MTEDQQERLRTLEATVSEIRVRQSQMESLLEQQIVAAGQIKSDTEEIGDTEPIMAALFDLGVLLALLVGVFAIHLIRRL